MNCLTKNPTQKKLLALFLLPLLVNCKKPQKPNPITEPKPEKQEISSLRNVLYNPISYLGAFTKFDPWVWIQQRVEVLTFDPVYNEMNMIVLEEKESNRCPSIYTYNSSVDKTQFYQSSLETKKNIFKPYQLWIGDFTFFAGQPQDTIYPEQLAKSKLLIYNVDENYNVLSLAKEMAFERKHVVQLAGVGEPGPFFDLDGNIINSIDIYKQTYILPRLQEETHSRTLVYDDYNYERDSAFLADNPKIKFQDLWLKGVYNQYLTFRIHRDDFVFDNELQETGIIDLKKNHHYKLEFVYARRDGEEVRQHFYYTTRRNFYCLPRTEEKRVKDLIEDARSDYWQKRINFYDEEWMQYFRAVN